MAKLPTTTDLFPSRTSQFKILVRPQALVYNITVHEMIENLIENRIRKGDGNLVLILLIEKR